MPLTLPPLNAVRAFEAAARAGSYVAAAEELNVSPAAVSQQVRNLEDYLGRKLFMRFNNRITLTDAGQEIFAGVSDSLHTISALTEQSKAGEARSRLVVSAFSSVAQRWLEPRIAAFALRERTLRIDLRIEDDPVDFARYDVDLRICYGAKLYPKMTLIHLCQDDVLPLCSPAYLKRNLAAEVSGMEAVPDDDLIHTSWGASFVAHPTWHEWFTNAGAERPNDSKGYRVGMSSLALDLARDGVGVALGQRMMAGEDLVSKRLVPLSALALPMGHPYCLVHPPGRAKKRGLKSLIDWLIKSTNRSR